MELMHKATVSEGARILNDFQLGDSNKEANNGDRIYPWTRMELL